MRAFSKMTLLIGGLIVGYFLRPMAEPMINNLLNNFKK